MRRKLERRPGPSQPMRTSEGQKAAATNLERRSARRPRPRTSNVAAPEGRGHEPRTSQRQKAAATNLERRSARRPWPRTSNVAAPEGRGHEPRTSQRPKVVATNLERRSARRVRPEGSQGRARSAPPPGILRDKRRAPQARQTTR